MSALSEPQRSSSSRVEGPGATPAQAGAEDAQRDALPVLADGAALLSVRRIEELSTRSPQALASPLVQAVAAAAGGFVAGAAVVGLAQRRQRRAAPDRRRRAQRRSVRGGGSGARASELVQIVGTRSLLVDVHLLGER